MDRFKNGNSMQDKINQLTKENENLKYMVKKQQKKRRWHNIIGIMLIATGLLFLGILAYGEWKGYLSARKVKRLQEQKNAAYNDTDIPLSDILPEYRKMYKTNSDLAGWIVINGTDINYQVVQSKVYQEFYLDHNFDGEEDNAGYVFADARNDLMLPDDNIIIYGHNMKDGSMFGTLQYYLDKDYYNKHNMISFDTLRKHGTYKIAVVGLSKISEESDGTFKYYDFINADSKKAFKKYVENIKKLEAYDTGISLEYGDKLVTLSTCNSVEKDGRLFIVAKEVKNEQN